MKKFLIAEAEKARILGMHYKAMGKSLVNEQDYKPEEFAKAGIQQLSSIDAEDAAAGRYGVAFTENTNGRRYYYNCATNPKYGQEAWNKAGAIYDGSYKLVNDPFVLSQSPEFKKIMAQECRPVFDYIAQQNAKNAPQPQVAAATTKPTTATAPNPTTDKDVADAQKRAENVKAQTAQAKAQLTAKVADVNFLNPNKEKAELDKDAQEASTLIVTASPTGDDAMALKRKINTLIKVKPEYKAEPFGLNINF